MAIHANWTLKDLMILSLVKGLKYGTIKSIIESYSSLVSFIDSREFNEITKKLSERGLFDSTIDLLSDEADRQLELCEKAECRLVSFWDSDYPYYLKDIVFPPNILFTKGVLQKPDSLCISIVGTRKCTLYGKLTAERFTEHFVQYSIPIVSGLAMGIDTVCHNAAINAHGITYAVIASGVDQINPSYAEKLSDRIVESGGAIISEYKCGTVAHPGYFPQRNRIISGISKATVVVEAGSRSGASITANFAFDQQRDVFAVPGNISSDKSIGCNKLIRDSKAAIAMSPEDVLVEAGYISNDNRQIAQKRDLYFSSTAEETVYNIITDEPRHIDEIATDCSIEVSELLVILLKLEFSSAIRQLPGKYYIKQN